MVIDFEGEEGLIPGFLAAVGDGSFPSSSSPSPSSPPPPPPPVSSASCANRSGSFKSSSVSSTGASSSWWLRPSNDGSISYMIYGYMGIWVYDMGIWVKDE